MVERPLGDLFARVAATDAAEAERHAEAWRDDEPLEAPWAQLVAPQQTVVIYMGVHGLEELCAELIAHGMAPGLPAAIVERGTTPEQRVLVATVGDLSVRARAAGVRDERFRGRLSGHLLLNRMAGTDIVDSVGEGELRPVSPVHPQRVAIPRACRFGVGGDVEHTAQSCHARSCLLAHLMSSLFPCPHAAYPKAGRMGSASPARWNTWNTPQGQNPGLCHSTGPKL